MARRVLVCGGSGYLGSILVRRVLERGDACAVLDLRDADDRPPAAVFHAGDVRDAPFVRRACEGADAVLHCVAQVPLAKDRGLFASVNGLGTENVLAAASATGVRKVVYVSSSAVYGAPARNPVDERTDPRPAEAYGRAKLDGERRCRAYAARGLDVSIVRPRTILGHGRLGIFQILFEWVRRGDPVPVLGRGANRYQFVHADDLADAILRAADRSGPAEYNCGAEAFTTLGEDLSALCRHAGTGSRVVRVPRAAAEGGLRLADALGLSPLGPYHALMYGRSLWFDIRRAREELGWIPRYSNAEMLVESYEWYLRNRTRILASPAASPHRSALRQGILSWAPPLLRRLVSWP